eukprot:COSAG02_NODE_53600_length_300_cov_4.383085_1_plen_42_part_01
MDAISNATHVESFLTQQAGGLAWMCLCDVFLCYTNEALIALH